MYAKLFARVAESSLMEESIDVRYTFFMLLAIADPKGYVVGTDKALARRLNMPLGDFQRCISRLREPDPNSTSKTLDGRRVVISDADRGYLVVNYAAYDAIRNPEERRTYMRDYMREYREGVNSSKQALAPVDAVSPSSATASATASTHTSPSSAIAEERFARFWKAYPRKEGKKVARQAFKKLKVSDELLGQMLEAIKSQQDSENWQKDNGRYIPHPSTWLNQGRWEDEGVDIKPRKHPMGDYPPDWVPPFEDPTEEELEARLKAMGTTCLSPQNKS